MDTPSAQWFFSTCAQTFGAMVGVFGMFVVFRLQSNSSRIDTILNCLRAYDPETHTWLRMPEDILIGTAKIRAGSLRSNNQPQDADPLDELLRRYESAKQLRSEISKRSILPTSLMMMLIGYSLFNLWLISWANLDTCDKKLLALIVLVVSVFPMNQITNVIRLAVREL